jgi:hypothetical protein
VAVEAAMLTQTTEIFAPSQSMSRPHRRATASINAISS